MAKGQWIVVNALVVAAGMAYGETISVTAFGSGSTRNAAIESGKRQALKDVSGSSQFIHEKGTKQALATTTGQIGQLRIIGVKKLGPGSYEAEVEADVEVATLAPVAHRQRVGLVGDFSKSESGISNELLEAVKDRLSTSNQLTVLGHADPAIAGAIERVNTARAQKTLDSVKTGQSSSVDLLCVVIVEKSNQIDGSASDERPELKTRLMFIDVVTGETKKIRTIKSARSPAPGDANSMTTLNASKQIAKAIVEYVTSPIERPNSTNEITVSTGSVKLGIGQLVTIYKVTKTSNSSFSREVSVTTGEVIGVGPSYAKVIAEDYLVKTDRHVVKPILTTRSRGVVSDSDW